MNEMKIRYIDPDFYHKMLVALPSGEVLHSNIIDHKNEKYVSLKLVELIVEKINKYRLEESFTRTNSDEKVEEWINYLVGIHKKKISSMLVDNIKETVELTLFGK